MLKQKSGFPGAKSAFASPFLVASEPDSGCYGLTLMLELEVYAAGLRNLEKILELDLEFESVPSLRYKVDTNHDIVYMEFEEPTLTIQEIRAIFRKLNLDAKVVGTIPPELNPKRGTQLIGTA